MALIDIQDIWKTYKVGDVELNALKQVSLSINTGEFLSIMGPSGSGKSTFMNMLGCLDTPTSGKYYLDGIDVSSLGRDELADIRNIKIGFVFQGFNLIPRTSALENVELPMIYSKTSVKDRKSNAVEALRIVGLKDRENHTPNQLSEVSNRELQ